MSSLTRTERGDFYSNVLNPRQKSVLELPNDVQAGTLSRRLAERSCYQHLLNKASGTISKRMELHILIIQNAGNNPLPVSFHLVAISEVPSNWSFNRALSVSTNRRSVAAYLLAPDCLSLSDCVFHRWRRDGTGRGRQCANQDDSVADLKW